MIGTESSVVQVGRISRDGHGQQLSRSATEAVLPAEAADQPRRTEPNRPAPRP
jgi:hypothetical protein